ncbi:MAG: YraN family protein [Patescibacteria group bacterium]
MGLTQERGKRGEDLAADFLRAKGYTIVARNVRSPFGEIDLVCKEQDSLVFVEVRYRASSAFGRPEETVVGHKLLRMQRSAEWYVTHKNYAGDYRIDVIGITRTQGQMTHLRNVS